jgi:hypothetical protein
VISKPPDSSLAPATANEAVEMDESPPCSSPLIGCFGKRQKDGYQECLALGIRFETNSPGAMMGENRLNAPMNVRRNSTCRYFKRQNSRLTYRFFQVESRRPQGKLPAE